MSLQKTILIVDDEEILVSVLVEILESPEKKILSASNGLIGLEIIEKGGIDCVVCDLKMPVMDGLELIKRVRAKNIDVPVIFYSGHEEKETKINVIQYGVFDFIDKPELPHLEEIINRALGKPKNEEFKFVSEYQKLIKENLKLKGNKANNS